MTVSPSINCNCGLPDTDLNRRSGSQPWPRDLQDWIAKDFRIILCAHKRHFAIRPRIPYQEDIALVWTVALAKGAVRNLLGSSVKHHARHPLEAVTFSFTASIAYLFK